MSNSTTNHGDGNNINQTFLNLILIKKEWIVVVGDICLGAIFFMSGVIGFYLMSYKRLIDVKSLSVISSQDYIGALFVVLFFSVLGGFFSLYIWLLLSYIIRRFSAEKKLCKE